MKNQAHMKHACLGCGSEDTEAVFSWQALPANIGILWPSRESALNCKKGELDIRFCHACGYVWNTLFDPDRLEYSQAYDNNLHYSATYRRYARQTAKKLIDRYSLMDKTVLEIGCGKGDFLILLCTLAANKGIGFDTSFESRDLDPNVSDRISIIQDFYSDKYANYSGDLIASRYVLEHIDHPRQFLEVVRNNIGNKMDTVVYFEVPDVYLILEQLSVWDFIYEHVSYFSPGSLATLFENCGFEIIDLYETFGGQFIGIEAKPVSNPNFRRHDVRPDLSRLKTSIKGFQPKIDDKCEIFTALLHRIRNENLRVLAWGAGAKGVSYLNMLNVREEIPFVVDINPNKQGKFIAGTGQKIVSPEFAREYAPHMVVVMNPNYTEEISDQLSKLEVQAELVPV